jgi:DNA-binding response OmpR family regulator
VTATEQTVLLIEDNAAFREAVGRVLARAGYAVAQAPTGKAGLERAAANRPDLVILDMVLPGLKGLEVCQRLKSDAATAAIPVLILTGNDKDGQEVACLDLGADDYLTKPVATERLLAHVRALLRRGAKVASPADAVTLGALQLHYARKLVVLGGQEHPELTPTEFGLLFELAQRSPQPVERAALYHRVWGMEPPSEMSVQTVDVHIRRIRLKLGWPADCWLSYVRGRGYSLTPP